MPFAEVNLQPGVNVETSAADNPSGVQESNFIRWRASLPEKRGGCTLYIDQPMNGTPVSLKPWGDFQGESFLGIATPNEVYAYNATTQTLRDISPQYSPSPSASPRFTTAIGSQYVSVVDLAAPTLSAFSAIQFNTPVAVGGLILNSIYPLISASSGGNFVFDAGYPATSAVSNVLGTLPIFSTTAGISRILVNFPIQYQYDSLAVGDRIGFSVPTTVGGITILGQYVISAILGVNFYAFQANYTALSSDTQTMNGGFADITYWITTPPGIPSLLMAAAAPEIVSEEPASPEVPEAPAVMALALPPGVDPAPAVSLYTANNWWLDSIQSTFIAAAENGPIFSFSPVGGYQNLTIVTGGPPASAGAFVAMPSGQIMAWGTSDYLDPVQNPLYIRWSDASDFTNWTIGGQSTAGFYNIPTGSKIVRGIQAPNQQFWFTDIDVYTAQYTSYPDFFSFLKIGAGCGLVAPRAVNIVNNSIYWMSQEQFFVCQSGSAPQPLPCSVWDFIFQNATQANLANTICGANSLYNEVIWFFPSATSTGGIPDAYVCYNTLYNEWDYGYLSRTAWTDQSVLGYPIAADANGWIYQHETSYDLAVGQTTQPITASLTTGYQSLTNGEDLIFVDWVLPDMKWGEYSQSPDASIQYTFNVTDYAGQTPRVYGPYTATKQTPYVSPRFRGRFMSMKIQSSDLGSFWRLGSIRYRYAPSGRR